jgi:hypothetical protein
MINRILIPQYLNHARIEHLQKSMGNPIVGVGQIAFIEGQPVEKIPQVPWLFSRTYMRSVRVTRQLISFFISELMVFAHWSFSDKALNGYKDLESLAGLVLHIYSTRIPPFCSARLF